MVVIQLEPNSHYCLFLAGEADSSATISSGARSPRSFLKTYAGLWSVLATVTRRWACMDTTRQAGWRLAAHWLVQNNQLSRRRLQNRLMQI